MRLRMLSICTVSKVLADGELCLRISIPVPQEGTQVQTKSLSPFNLNDAIICD